MKKKIIIPSVLIAIIAVGVIAWPRHKEPNVIITPEMRDVIDDSLRGVTVNGKPVVPN